MGTWNVYSMVDTEGLIEVASRLGQRGEDRRVDLIEMELKRYDAKVAAFRKPSGLEVRCIRWKEVWC